METKASVLHLSEIWKPDSLKRYKLHFARRNEEGIQPLDALASDFEGGWRSWQEWRPKRDDFNRDFILALAQDYRQPDRWLFGGIWQVRDRLPDRYEVELSEEMRPLIKRLWLRIDHRARATRCKLESYFDELVVDEVARWLYTARAFPGLQSLTVSFSELENIVKHGIATWREPLSAVHGIYLLRVEETNSNYVGAAYGGQGVWGRWMEYVMTGHGNNALTRKVFGSDPVAYARKNVSFTLLEPVLPAVSDREVIERERYWMNALGTRSLDNLNT